MENWKETIKDNIEDVKDYCSRECAKQYRQLKDFLKETVWLFRCNYRPILIFLVTYAVLNEFLVNTVYDAAIHQMMRFANVTYVGPDNLGVVLLAPLNWIVIFIMLVILSLCSIFEIGSLSHAYCLSQIGKDTSVSGMVSAGLYACKRALMPKNWLIFPFLMVLLPLTDILALSSASISVMIPEFVLDFIVANNLYRQLYRGAYIILVLLEISCVYSINFFLIEEKSFLKACKDSVHVIKEKYMTTILSMIAVAIFFSLAVTACASVVSDIINVICKTFVSNFGSLTSKYFMMNAVTMAKHFFNGLIVPPLNVAALTVLFFRFVEEKGLLVKMSKRSFNDYRVSDREFMVLVSIFSIALFFGVSSHRNDWRYVRNETQAPKIVAHRGDSVRAPENTMPAFELALAEKVDWVEFDVFQMKDGTILVSHDDYIKRVSGKNIYLHNLNYEDVKDLDVGSWFSPEYSYVRFSKLEDVLQLFKDSGIMLQIELKVHGHENGFEEAVLQKIYENGMQDQCIVTSLNPIPLKRMKELDPTIKTTYSMFVAWEGVQNIEFADGFTIEEGNYQTYLANDIHTNGKYCFAWTVNTEETVQYLADCGVDAILTDDPIMLRNALDKVDYSGGIRKFMRLYFKRVTSGM